MIKRIKSKFVDHKGQNVLLLRILLMLMVVAIVYMIFAPSGSGKSKKTYSKKIILNGVDIPFNEPFRMPTQELCSSVLESKITKVEKDSIDISFLNKLDADRVFREINPPVTYTIKNGDCVPAIAMCVNTVFEYCFTIKTNTNPVVVDYMVKQK